MKRKLLFVGIATAILFTACTEKKEEEKKNNVDADVKQMCECFEEGKTNSEKYMKCLEQGDKIRAKYNDDIKIQAEYDKKLSECMK